MQGNQADYSHFPDTGGPASGLDSWLRNAVATNVISKPQREREDRQSRIRESTGREHRATGDVEIRYSMHAAVNVDHPGFRTRSCESCPCDGRISAEVLAPSLVDSVRNSLSLTRPTPRRPNSAANSIMVFSTVTRSSVLAPSPGMRD